MEPRRAQRRLDRLVDRSVRLLALVLVTAAAVLVGADGRVAAGGWAVGSLDSTPVATAGATTEVGFTILQHGVTPARLVDHGLADDDLGIEIEVGAASVEFFPAVAQGRPGHYVATVRLPDVAGTYPWRIRMGWFGPHDLGTIDVGEPDGGATSLRSRWSGAQWTMLALGTAIGAIAVADAAATRRRRQVAVT